MLAIRSQVLDLPASWTLQTLSHQLPSRRSDLGTTPDHFEASSTLLQSLTITHMAAKPFAFHTVQAFLP